MEGELELVRRAAAGEDDAFRILVQGHARRLFALAYRITGQRESAEDVVQETFMKAHRALHRFDGRATFATWLHRIATNTALDVTRQRKVRQEVAYESEEGEPLPLPSSEPGPERQAVSGDLRRALARAMAGLSTLERTAFVLRHYEGCHTDEIAATLGLEAGASRQAVFRAVRKLRQALAPFTARGVVDEVAP